MWSLGPQHREGRCWHLPPSHPSRAVLCCRELLAGTSRGAQPALARCCRLPAWHPCLSLSAPVKCLFLCAGADLFSFLGGLPPKFPAALIAKCSVPNAQARRRLKSPSLCPPFGCLPAILRASLGVQWEVPMFGSVAQNSRGCSGWGSWWHLLLGSRVARGHPVAVNNAHSCPVTNSPSSGPGLCSSSSSPALPCTASTQLCLVPRGSLSFPWVSFPLSFSLDNEGLGSLPRAAPSLRCFVLLPGGCRGHPWVLVSPGLGSQGFAAGAQGRRKSFMQGIHPLPCVLVLSPELGCSPVSLLGVSAQDKESGLDEVCCVL